jgi:hypothetical protein
MYVKRSLPEPDGQCASADFRWPTFQGRKRFTLEEGILKPPAAGAGVRQSNPLPPTALFGLRGKKRAIRRPLGTELRCGPRLRREASESKPHHSVRDDSLAPLAAAHQICSGSIRKNRRQQSWST